MLQFSGGTSRKFSSRLALAKRRLRWTAADVDESFRSEGRFRGFLRRGWPPQVIREGRYVLGCSGCRKKNTSRGRGEVAFPGNSKQSRKVERATKLLTNLQNQPSFRLVTVKRSPGGISRGVGGEVIKIAKVSGGTHCETWPLSSTGPDAVAEEFLWWLSHVCHVPSPAVSPPCPRSSRPPRRSSRCRIFSAPLLKKSTGNQIKTLRSLPS